MSQSNDRGLNLDRLEALPSLPRAHKLIGRNLDSLECLYSETQMREYAHVARRAALANQPAPTVPDSFKVRQDFLDWNRAKSDPAVKIGREYAVAEKLMELMAHQPAQEQASTTRVTETKRAQLEARGYEVVGYVMQNSVNELCTLAHGRVEWLGKPAQATQQEPVAAPQQTAAPKARIGSIEDYNEFNRLLHAYADEQGDKTYRALASYIDKWADRRAAQLDGGQEGSESNG
jgi:hypothetical protein